MERSRLEDDVPAPTQSPGLNTGGSEVVEKITYPENPAIRQDLTPMLSEMGAHAEFLRRGISKAVCETLGIGYLGVGRSILKGRVVFQIRDMRMVEGTPQPVILSHIGYNAEAEEKWRHYKTYDPSLDFYGQESLAFDPHAVEQAQESGALLLAGDPFEMVKAHDCGLRNIVSPMGAALTQHQVDKLQRMAQRLGVACIRFVYPRDEAAQAAQFEAAKLVETAGLTPVKFDWEAVLGRNQRGEITIAKSIQTLGDMTLEQITWLRNQRLI